MHLVHTALTVGAFLDRGADAVAISARWLRNCHFYAIIFTMKATIDAAGRIVVPKPLRLALGLKPGQPLAIRAGDGRPEREIAATPMRGHKRGKGGLASPEPELPLLPAAWVCDTWYRFR